VRAHGGVGAAALAVSALAVGVLACAFSWMFFIQGYIIAAGALAALLGLAGVLAARRGDHSPTLAVAGAVLGVLSIVAVFTTEAVIRSILQDSLGGLLSESDQGTTDFPSDPALPSSEEPLPTAPPGTGGGSPPPPAGDLAPDNSDAPLPVGSPGELTGFTVTVTSVITNAAETIEGGGNPPPINGRYVLVELSATYTGEDTGTVGPPFLSVGLVGGDGLEYRDESCTAVLDQSASTVPPLSTGESGSWQACIDTTPGALEGATLFVGQLFASNEERVYWQLG
jgi:hypothetical protein